MEDLKEITEFKSSPELIAKLYQFSVRKQYEAGSIILNENSHIRSIPIVTKGTLKVIRIEEDGREKAVLAGANIIMPNLTPNEYREDYMIYPNKACTQDSAKQCRGCLAMRMKSINHTIGYNEWGDSLLAKKQE